MPIIRTVLALFFVTLVSAAQAASLPQGLTPELLGQLQQGGLNIFFRHGATLHEKDPVDDALDDPLPANCALQRNLSREGVEQMRAVGAAFDALGIPAGTVRASPLCRCNVSAWHAFGRVERDRNLLLNGDTPEGSPSQTRPWNHIRALGKVLPPPMTNAIFISHSRIGEIFGDDVLMEGEAIIIAPDGKGGWTALARVTAEEWVLPK